MISGLSIRELKELPDETCGLAGMPCNTSLMEHVVVIIGPFMVSNIKKFQGALKNDKKQISEGRHDGLDYDRFDYDRLDHDTVIIGLRYDNAPDTVHGTRREKVLEKSELRAQIRSMGKRGAFFFPGL